MKRHAIALALACASCAASALEPPAVVGLNLGSVHAHDGKGPAGARGWNNVNPGLYARWRGGFTVGAFRNSLYRNSVYAGWSFGAPTARFGLLVGMVSGYDRVTDGPGDYSAVRCSDTCRRVNLDRVIAPMVVPSVRFGLTDRMAARLSVVASPGAPVAVHLSIEYGL